MRRARGSISRNSCSDLGARLSNWPMPVALPPGLARLDTRPAPTGSEAVAKTIGMVRVARRATTAAGCGGA
jgi:hypothetical protein